MAKYTSIHTGKQVDDSIAKVLELVNTSAEINSAVGKALKLDDIAYVSQEAVEGTNYHILWKVQPTESNSVSGFAIHPSTGRLTLIYSNNGVKTASHYIAGQDYIPSSEIEDLFK